MSHADLDNNNYWRNKSSTGDNDQPSSKWVRNLSSRSLSDKEISVLGKGLNYAVTPKQLPITELITATELAIKQAITRPYQAAEEEEIRHDISSLLSVPHNLSAQS